MRALTIGSILVSLTMACGASDRRGTPAEGGSGGSGGGSSGETGSGGSSGEGTGGSTGGTAGEGSGGGGAPGGTSGGGAAGTSGGSGGSNGGSGGSSSGGMDGGTPDASAGGGGGSTGGSGGSGGSNGTPLTLTIPAADAGSSVTLDVDGCYRFSDSQWDTVLASETADQDEVYIYAQGDWYLSNVAARYGNYRVQFWRMNNVGMSYLEITNLTTLAVQYLYFAGLSFVPGPFFMWFYFNRTTEEAGAFAPMTDTTGTPLVSTALGAHSGDELAIGGQGSRTCEASFL